MCDATWGSGNILRKRDGQEQNLLYCYTDDGEGRKARRRRAWTTTTRRARWQSLTREYQTDRAREILTRPNGTPGLLLRLAPLLVILLSVSRVWATLIIHNDEMV